VDWCFGVALVAGCSVDIALRGDAVVCQVVMLNYSPGVVRAPTLGDKAVQFRWTRTVIELWSPPSEADHLVVRADVHAHVRLLSIGEF